MYTALDTIKPKIAHTDYQFNLIIFEGEKSLAKVLAELRDKNNLTPSKLKYNQFFFKRITINFIQDRGFALEYLIQIQYQMCNNMAEK